MRNIIQIFCPNISKYWSLKIRGNAGIKEVLFSFFTWKDTFSTKSKSYNNLILVWLYLKHWAFSQNTTFFWYFSKSFIFALQIIQKYLNIWILCAIWIYFAEQIIFLIWFCQFCKGNQLFDSAQNNYSFKHCKLYVKCCQRWIFYFWRIHLRCWNNYVHTFSFKKNPLDSTESTNI